MPSAEENRLNISVSKSCKNAIDELVKTTGLFKGYSDFVFSAIRSLYSRQYKLLSGVFIQIDKTGCTAIEKERLLKDALTEQGNTWSGIADMVYPGPLVAQISIRPNDSIKKTIGEMALLFSPNDSEANRIQNVCRIAIFFFTNDLENNYKFSKEVSEKYKQIIESAERELSELKQKYSASGGEDV